MVLDQGALKPQVEEMAATKVDKKTEEELKRAQERGKSGTPQVGEFKNNKKKKGVDRNMQDLKMYDLPHTKIVPKDG